MARIVTETARIVPATVKIVLATVRTVRTLMAMQVKEDQLKDPELEQEGVPACRSTSFKLFAISGRSVNPPFGPDAKNTAHRLLAQIPLTVSPFAGLPTSITLPYDYISLPASLPPSSSSQIVSPSGQSSISPEQLIVDCNNLAAYLTGESKTAKEDLEKWVKSIDDRELMEKRRVAPGWLDTGVLMLEPTKSGPPQGGLGPHVLTPEQKMLGVGDEDKGKQATSPGEELDRAFGGMGI
ncbi:hypothetical protein H072_144 [Dactylellina haptotyla CBS 200.50]|uniref:Uncharacterized protein n=1 Tax=Dactylellina haptotyla (strain CBS 200.50) TaxID=1284197 RepID=S8ASF9_DACHA|nr:hypothetical protein H072_144 [Dactylellina haptotyla CBS 200.50]